MAAADLEALEAEAAGGQVESSTYREAVEWDAQAKRDLAEAEALEAAAQERLDKAEGCAPCWS